MVIKINFLNLPSLEPGLYSNRAAKSEAAALETLSELGYSYLYSPDIAPETDNTER